MNFTSQQELLEEQRRIHEVNQINSKNQMFKSIKISTLQTLQLSRDFCYNYLKSKEEYKSYSDILNQQKSFDEVYKSAFNKCITKRLAGNNIITNSFNKSIDDYLDKMDVNRYFTNLYS